MFGISFSEVILILVIAIIVFGPKQIPEIAAKAGHIIFSIRQMLNKFKQEVYQQSGFNEFNNTKQEIINSYRQIRNDIITSPTIEYIHPENITEEHPLYQPELDFSEQPELFR